MLNAASSGAQALTVGICERVSIRQILGSDQHQQGFRFYQLEGLQWGKEADPARGLDGFIRLMLARREKVRQLETERGGNLVRAAARFPALDQDSAGIAGLR